MFSRDNRSYAGSLLLQGAGAVCGLLLQVSLAKWLDPAGYGQVSTIIAATTILALVSTVGTNGAALRLVPHFQAVEEEHRAVEFVSFVLTTTSLVSVAVGIAFGLVAGLLPLNLATAALIAGGGLIIASALQLVGTDLARLAQRFTMAYASALIVRPLVASACVVAALALGIDRSVPLALLALSIGSISCVAIQLTAVHRGFGPPALRFRRPSREWLRSSPTYVVISAFQLLLSQVDLLAVSAFLSSASVGYYAAALRISAVLTLPYVAVMAIIRPRISTFGSQADGRAGALKLATQSTVWCGLATSALGVPMLIWPGLTLRVFGGSFGNGHFALQALALGQILISFTGPGAALLVYMDQRRPALIGIVVCTVASAVGCAFGAQLDGINGAAVASAASSALVGVVMYWLTWRYLGMRVSVVEAFVPALRQSTS